MLVRLERCDQQSLTSYVDIGADSDVDDVGISDRFRDPEIDLTSSPDTASQWLLIMYIFSHGICLP